MRLSGTPQAPIGLSVSILDLLCVVTRQKGIRRTCADASVSTPRSHWLERCGKVSRMPACMTYPICNAHLCHAIVCLVISVSHSPLPTGCLPPCRYIARCFRGARRRSRAPFPSMGLDGSMRHAGARQALPKAVCESPLPACGPLALSMSLRPARSQCFPALSLASGLSAPPDRTSRRLESLDRLLDAVM
jgi:hypothetical protein